MKTLKLLLTLTNTPGHYTMEEWFVAQLYSVVTFYLTTLCDWISCLQFT